FFIFLLAFILTMARGIFIAFFISLIVYIILGRCVNLLSWKFIFKIFITLAGILTFITMLYFLNENVEEIIDQKVFFIFNNFQGLSELKDLSAVTRIAELAVVKRIFVDYPVLGIGVGNMVYHSPLYFEYVPYISDFLGISLFIVSNLYASFLAETGLIGIIFFMFFLIIMLWRTLYTLFKTQDQEIKILLLSVVPCLIGVFCYWNFYPDFGLNVWFVFAAALFLNKQGFKKC
ncbi:O-antigen ligase family protein, partial [bacterium]|nr:O-antigen ligase family protein [bacterium]